GRRGLTRRRLSRRRRTPMDTFEAKLDDSRLPADIDAQPVVRAAAELQPMLRDYHDEIERNQRFPKELVEQMRAAGFYRMVLPRSLGGLQVDPITYTRVAELLAEGAGSVRWNNAHDRSGHVVQLRR